MIIRAQICAQLCACISAYYFECSFVYVKYICRYVSKWWTYVFMYGNTICKMYVCECMCRQSRTSSSTQRQTRKNSMQSSVQQSVNKPSNLDTASQRPLPTRAQGIREDEWMVICGSHIPSATLAPFFHFWNIFEKRFIFLALVFGF